MMMMVEIVVNDDIVDDIIEKLDPDVILRSENIYIDELVDYIRKYTGQLIVITNLDIYANNVRKLRNVLYAIKLNNIKLNNDIVCINFRGSRLVSMFPHLSLFDKRIVLDGQ